VSFEFEERKAKAPAKGKPEADGTDEAPVVAAKKTAARPVAKKAVAKKAVAKKAAIRRPAVKKAA
jgi:DNA topoisomerase-3